MEENELLDGGFFLLANSYFDCREYKRAAHVFRDRNGSKLAGEKWKEEEMIELEEPLGKSAAAKRQYSLREFDQVEAIFEELLSNDPYRVEDMDMYSNVR
ncbi:hypothetical protein Fmac_002079 [Flemingia macrophylla]|uniref:Cdc23 domain-containing protein n=1 Tax=Flemingia macrophylla TaxID=520843 RepID=A0ABD1NIY0_9FABA